MNPDRFRCEVSYRRGSWVIALFEELDLAADSECEAALRLVQGAWESVTLDLRGLTFMDSSGVRFILALSAMAARDGFELRVIKGNAAVQRVLELSGVEDRLEMRDARPTASGRHAGRQYALIATDLAGIVTRWNAEAERLYGWSAREAVGRPVTQLIVGPDEGQLAQEIMDCVRRDGAWSGQFDVRGKDGRRFVAHVRTALVEDDRGNPVGFAGVSIAAAQRATAAA